VDLHQGRFDLELGLGRLLKTISVRAVVAEDKTASLCFRPSAR
jgi:hypothetical protein